jgi:hypothetical protein
VEDEVIEEEYIGEMSTEGEVDEETYYPFTGLQNVQVVRNGAFVMKVACGRGGMLPDGTRGGYRGATPAIREWLVMTTRRERPSNTNMVERKLKWDLYNHMEGTRETFYIRHASFVHVPHELLPPPPPPPPPLENGVGIPIGPDADTGAGAEVHLNASSSSSSSSPTSSMQPTSPLSSSSSSSSSSYSSFSPSFPPPPLPGAATGTSSPSPSSFSTSSAAPAFASSSHTHTPTLSSLSPLANAGASVEEGAEGMETEDEPTISAAPPLRELDVSEREAILKGATASARSARNVFEEAVEDLREKEKRERGGVGVGKGKEKGNNMDKCRRCGKQRELDACISCRDSHILCIYCLMQLVCNMCWVVNRSTTYGTRYLLYFFLFLLFFFFFLRSNRASSPCIALAGWIAYWMKAM